MQIAAFDADDLADDTGKAKITWISKDCLATKHKMNPTNTTEGGWAASELRMYLKNTVKAKIPSAVTSLIKDVKKYSDSYVSGSVVANSLSIEDVWIPSAREVGATNYETSGVKYDTLFTDYDSRVKSAGTSKSNWWLRSSNDNSYFRIVSANGGIIRGNANETNNGVTLGFCT